MFNTLRRKAALWASMVAILLAAAPAAYSQAPTDAQRSAIRSQCRSDYQAHCSSIPPGGKASLQCLQQNMSSLSSGCQAAVRAVEAPAAPKAESAPAAPKAESAPAAPAESAPAAPPPASNPPPAAKAAASAGAKKPSSAQVSAIRSACRSDYQQHCTGVPTGGAAALSCLEKNKAKLSANCQKAVTAAGGGAKTPADDDAATAPAAGGAPTDAATTAAPAAAPALVLRAMRPREVIFVLRSACGADVRSLCGDVPAGGGRIIQCLAGQAASLSPACADVLRPFAAQ
jgi:Cysteine rich repeat